MKKTGGALKTPFTKKAMGGKKLGGGRKGC